MKNNIAKIRAALEQATGGRPSNIAAAQAALAALAELERASKEPACIVESARIEGPTICRRLMWLRVVGAGEKLYTTPPPAKPAPGMFTAEEMEAAYMEAMLDADSGAADWRKRAEYDWKISNAAKLVRERTP